jgi:hypothetical protein
MAEAFVALMQRFGGPTEDDPGNNQTRMLWQAFASVTEVCVEPGSTSFRNPATSEQSAVQLYISIMQQMPAWEGLAAKGVVPAIPDPVAAFQHLLRAYNVNDYDNYLKASQPAPPQAMLSPIRERLLNFLYKEGPPDIKRQVEKEAGLQPSQMPEPEEPPTDTSKERLKAAVDLEKQRREHAHDDSHKILDSLLSAGNGKFE